MKLPSLKDHPFSKYITFATVLTLAISVLVLFGWVFDIRTLKSILPDYITMKVNTALLFALISSAILVRHFYREQAKVPVIVISSVAIALSVSTVLQYLLQMDFGIDEFLLADPDSIGGRFPPGRPAPITTLNFIFLAISLIVDRFRGRVWEHLGELLSAIVLFSSFQGLIGYAIGITYLFGSAFYTQMALHTALCFVLLSTAKLALNGEKGFVKTISEKGPAARLMRTMLISAAFVPTLVRWFSQAGVSAGLYDADFQALIQIVGVTSLIAVTVVFAGTILARNESATLESEEKFRALVDTTAQIVWEAAPNGSITKDSPSWRKFTGQSEVQWLGTGWSQALHEEDRENALRAWAAACATGEPYQVDYRLRHHSGQYRWTMARGTPLKNTDGHVRQWIGMNSDIHEQKLVQLDLKAAKDEAERANQLKSAFLANMSHEIRTPLGAILGFADLSASEEISAADRQKFVDVVKRNGEQLSVLISDILDFSKVEAGQMNLAFSPFDPRDIINQVAEEFRPKAAANGVELSVEVRGSFPDKINTDPLRLRQILMNVVGNAVKFTDHGRIVLRGSSFKLEDGTHGLDIEIEDTGIGIPPEHVNRIFEMFVQGDDSLTRKFGGTGLGLSLSRSLARMLGGDLRVLQSKVGAGTSFWLRITNQAQLAFEIERDAKALAAASIPADIAQRPLDRMRILVVDDSPDNLQLITANLVKRGAIVETAENGMEAIERVNKSKYDIVLMDLQMPVMDGYAATSQLRADGFTAPILAITAHAMADIRTRCLDVGCTDHLPKPINFTDLTKTIVRYVPYAGTGL